MYGNKVSHAHNKSRRKFNVNLQKKTFWVDSLNKSITLTVSAKGLRIIDKKGINVVIRDLVSQGKKF
jgi:large subunit ribosomal protein L28